MGRPVIAPRLHHQSANNSTSWDDRFPSSEFTTTTSATRAKRDSTPSSRRFSAKPILNKGHFSQLEIAPTTPSAEQQAIAAVLGADDKDRLNRRMNATLEAHGGGRCFQSWFRDFRSCAQATPGWAGACWGSIKHCCQVPRSLEEFTARRHSPKVMASQANQRSCLKKSFDGHTLNTTRKCGGRPCLPGDQRT